jgi:drug/metabolite transporter (DMT)-like permease
MNLVGSVLMVVGVVFFSEASRQASGIKPEVGSLVRVVCNLCLAIALAASFDWRRTVSQLVGKRIGWLSLFGSLGALTIISYFRTVIAGGVGVANFMLSASGSILVIMAVIFGRASPWQVALALASLLGAFLLGYGSRNGLTHDKALLWGGVSALACAAAYWVLSRYLAREAAVSLMFYWSLINLVIHAALWPQSWQLISEASGVWLLLLMSGGLASLGQYFVNQSYQTDDVGTTGLISYLASVMGLAIDWLWFDRTFHPAQVSGGLLILISAGLSLSGRIPKSTPTKAEPKPVT